MLGGHHSGWLGGAWRCTGGRIDGGSGVGLGVLWVKRLLWGQRLLRGHHGRPPRVAHRPHVGWLALGLARHPHGLLGHVWHGQLTGERRLLLLLHGQRGRRHGAAGHLLVHCSRHGLTGRRHVVL